MKIVPSVGHRPAIEKSRKATFRYRRDWIMSDAPTIADIVQKYKHLISYGGEMVILFFLPFFYYFVENVTYTPENNFQYLYVAD